VKHYRLVYRQPYECDDDIRYVQYSRAFATRGDEAVRVVVKDFLSEGGLDFGFHLGGPPAGLYPRQFVSLSAEFEPDRVIWYA